MSISDAWACASGFHCGFPGVPSCPSAKTQLWMRKCSPFPNPFPRTALQHLPLCWGKASSLQQRPGRSRTKVWRAGTEQTQSRGSAQEGESLPAGICSPSKHRDEMLSMGAEGWWGDAQSLLLCSVGPHPSLAFRDLILLLGEKHP